MVEDQFIEMETTSNIDITMIPVTQQVNSFYCPHAKHGKSSEGYCRSCFDNAKDDGISVNGGWKTEDELKWCIMRKEVVFDHDLCANAYLGND